MKLKITERNVVYCTISNLTAGDLFLLDERDRNVWLRGTKTSPQIIQPPSDKEVVIGLLSGTVTHMPGFQFVCPVDLVDGTVVLRYK